MERRRGDDRRGESRMGEGTAQSRKGKEKGVRERKGEKSGEICNRN